VEDPEEGGAAGGAVGAGVGGMGVVGVRAALGLEVGDCWWNGGGKGSGASGGSARSGRMACGSGILPGFGGGGFGRVCYAPQEG
jgi:hypothetical protein